MAGSSRSLRNEPPVLAEVSSQKPMEEDRVLLASLGSLQDAVVAVPSRVRDVEHREPPAVQHEIHEQARDPAVPVGEGVDRHELQVDERREFNRIHLSLR